MRRQTGNEYAYGGLLNLIHDWNLFSNDFGGSVTSSNFLRSILAFPIDDFFGDRIFEIWCLREVGESLKRLGASMLEGPNPLSQNKQNPTFRFNYYGHLIEVWFQRGLDKLEAHWTYDHSGSPLRGIPDITIIGNSTNYLIFDAKNRMVSGSTRSEETYKILGYLQNFQSLLEGPSCWGGLAFTSTTCFHQSLHCRTGRKLFMISAHPTDHTECGFRAQIDSQLASWLDAWAN